MHIRTGDLVIVQTGNDSGKKGKVLNLATGSGKAIVEGINLRWKTLRKSQKNPKGGRVQREFLMSVSNLLPFCSRCGKGVRSKREVKGKQSVRVCVKCSNALGGA